MFRILFDLMRYSIWNKDLLLHVNTFKTLKVTHMKHVTERISQNIITKISSLYYFNIIYNKSVLQVNIE